MILVISSILLQPIVRGDDTVSVTSDTSQYLTGSCIDRCHVNYMAYRTQYEGKAFRHDTHSPAQGLECNQCHNNDAVNTKTHGELKIQNKDCSVCHHKEANNEACLKCHADVKDYINGSFQNTVTKIQDWMSKAVLCTDCHKPEADVSSFKDVREYCVECHNHDYGLLYDMWEETLNDGIRQFARDDSNVHNETGKLMLIGTGSGNIVIDKKHILRIVRSYGIHNFRLSQIILKSVEQ